MSVRVRCPVAQDAQRISDVITRSITELCVADHSNDPEVLKDWLDNKSTQDVTGWLNGPYPMRVATTHDGTIAAVGMYTKAGEVKLLYVDPYYRGQGYSRAVLARIEAELHEFGISRAQLTSTATAQGFYLRQGWENTGENVACHKTDGYPMYKVLRST